MVSSQLCEQVIFLTCGLCTFSQDGLSGPQRIIFPSTICWADSALLPWLSITHTSLCHLAIANSQFLNIYVTQSYAGALRALKKGRAHRTIAQGSFPNTGQTTDPEKERPYQGKEKANVTGEQNSLPLKLCSGLYQVEGGYGENRNRICTN